MKDGHIHTPYCPHGSKDKLEDYIQKAIDVGLIEITFTEHLPLPNNFEDPSPKKDSAMDEDDILSYFKEVNFFKDKYKDKIKINVGVEVDYIEEYEYEIEKMLNKYGNYLDDSILSVHMIKIGEKYYCIDFSAEEFLKIVTKLGSIENTYNKYYETLKLAINSDLGIYKPKRIGHLNLVRKFNKLFPYDYDGNKRLDEIINLICEKDYELDFNTSSIRKVYCREPYIHGYLLELVNKYKIKTVLGSDSHSFESVGFNI
ncbi:histidinol-phosphatase HisJ [Romboutsia sp. Marseille-P6047]|uniref:histidinol-phosphatase HisJ n=1 Tax=Romboutsia sp. Marseille-P6047 TaxID=2161817 RepID=UPI000F047E81|nr:histidinol-phosphatase HisJ [Romboutsia sp. Marseille-P6047]